MESKRFFPIRQELDILKITKLEENDTNVTQM